jgi:hypothetical protein
MPKAPTTDTIVAGLSVPERVLLFCLASGTNWLKARVPTITVQHLVVRNLVDRDGAPKVGVDRTGTCGAGCIA